MVEINIKLTDGTTITLSLEQAKELHEKLNQVFVSKDVAPTLPWLVPFVQPVTPPVLTPSVPTLPASPYITWTGTTGVATYLLNPCASSDTFGVTLNH